MEISGTDLVAIIAACKEAKVYSFKKGDLAIEFAAPDTIEAVQPYSPMTLPVFEPLTQDQEREQQEIESANLLFEDPVEFEKQMMEGEGN